MIQQGRLFYLISSKFFFHDKYTLEILPKLASSVNSKPLTKHFCLTRAELAVKYY